MWPPGRGTLGWALATGCSEAPRRAGGSTGLPGRAAGKTHNAAGAMHRPPALQLGLPPHRAALSGAGPAHACPQVDGMAGERSRASFLLQLGLRAIAAGNTGGRHFAVPAQAPTPPAPPASQPGSRMECWCPLQRAACTAGALLAADATSMLPCPLAARSPQTARSTASANARPTCSSSWSWRGGGELPPPKSLRCSAGRPGVGLGSAGGKGGGMVIERGSHRLSAVVILHATLASRRSGCCQHAASAQQRIAGPRRGRRA